MRVTRPSPATVDLRAWHSSSPSAARATRSPHCPRDSVGSPQLRARAVKESELGNRAVITPQAGRPGRDAREARAGAVTGDRVVARRARRRADRRGEPRPRAVRRGGHARAHGRPRRARRPCRAGRSRDPGDHRGDGRPRGGGRRRRPRGPRATGAFVDSRRGGIDEFTVRLRCRARARRRRLRSDLDPSTPTCPYVFGSAPDGVGLAGWSSSTTSTANGVPVPRHGLCRSAWLVDGA